MAKRTDSNQGEIVQALRSCGASVQDLHALGHGCPDLAVGFRGINYLCEIKSEHGKLTDDERDWHAAWKGQVCVIRSIDDCLRLLGVVIE